MKNLLKTIVLASTLSATAFAATVPTIHVETAHQANVIALLTQTNTNLEKLIALNTQTEHTISAYSAFQFKTLEPTVPFPEWKSVSFVNARNSRIELNTINPSMITNNTIANFASDKKLNQNQKNEVSFIQQTLSSLDTGYNNAEKIQKKLNNYTNILNDNIGNINATQMANIRTRINLLSAKLSALRYVQNMKTQKILLMNMLTHIKNNKGEK